MITNMVAMSLNTDNVVRMKTEKTELIEKSITEERCEMDRKYDYILNIAAGLRWEAINKGFHPTSFVMGEEVYYGLKAFASDILMLQFPDDGTNVYGTLCGLPIKLTENRRWELSLEVDEFSVGLKEILLDEQNDIKSESL